MTTGQRYFEEQQLALAARPTLAEALLAGRFARYAFYRIRYLLTRTLLRTGLNFAELAFFFLVASPYYFGFILMARSTCGLIATLWWGALDALRTEVRDFYAARNRPSIDRLLGFWLRRTAWAALGVVFFITAVVVVRTLVRDVFSVFDAYAVACGFRIAADLLVRTYHSGAYAVRRVYRPLVAVLAIDILDVLGLVALWPWLGPWSFAVSLLATSVLSSGLTWWFALQTYHGLRLRPRVHLLRRRSSIHVRRRFGDIVIPALANSATELDGLVITLLVVGAQNDPITLALAAFVHGVRPMIGAGYNWARLFYFDFTLLGRGYASVLRRRFERLLARGAWLLGLGMWVLATAWSLVVFGGQLIWLGVLFFPLFLVRSRLSLAEIQLFSYRRYGMLIATTLSVGGGIATLALFDVQGLEMLAALIVLLGTALVALQSSHARHPVPCSLTSPSLPLPLWVRQVARTTSPVRISVLTTYARPTARTLHLIAAALTTARPHTLAAPITARRLLFAELGDTAELATPVDLVRAAGGLLEAVDILSSAPSGRRALDLAIARGVLSAPPNFAVSAPSGGDWQALLRLEAQRRFPSVLIIDDDPRAGHERLRTLPASNLHQLVRAIEQSGLGRNGARAQRTFDVTAFAPSGEPSLVFLVPRGEDPTARRQWREEVDRASLAATLGESA